MASKIKTFPTDKQVSDFILEFTGDKQKQADSYRLIQLMEAVSGHKPKIWGGGIIGFGSYHYRYASGHEGDAPLIGFSPRKAAISLYVFTGAEEHKPLLENLGKYKMGKACLYVKKLDDIREEVLTRLMRTTITYLESTYGA